ncbi:MULTISPECIES: DUF968 domain-containing protein [unclassified Vibrio]|uniref:DUF968 domain-containing protein n=2 Tax=unclassified Vibrio TaxID=2614977 RepID=UPI001483770E|nr:MULTISPECIES: DUF968 domain-containing protein [unclassified Vibrio]MDQ2107619.1 DUF968 domain-containing protein [Vibrio sp. 2017_1457_15]MDQ2160431.1 DUF968 domain-containing protein [Vibrio sp. 2017_1457_13]NNN44742.1 DUF968 domain-containing protein [Vibrio sp. 1-1(7)]NNN72115.1 DUF968 domain-containing protein [Vibrio sp. 12-2(3-a)]
MLVLQPFLQADLGIVMFKPGKTLLSELVKMSQGNRLVVMPLPDELVNVPSGKLNKPLLSSGDKSLVKDHRLAEFFIHQEVQKRLGGFNYWLERIPHCQLSDDGYCDKNLTTLNLDVGGVRLCWHHDNHERAIPTERCQEIAKRNVMLWAMERICYQLKLEQGHILTLAEVCWWSVVNAVYEYLPQSIVDEIFGVKPKKTTGELIRRESDDRYYVDSKDLLRDRVKKVELIVDDEPPALYMARPKELTWHCEKYLKFVRSLPCVITGKTVDVVAHHLIGHGEGKAGAKAHDLFTIPLHIDEHRRFHDDPKKWEAQHGSQLFYVKQTIKKALDLGALL